MGFYADRVLPRLVEQTCSLPALDPLRDRACAPLTGAVVEVGFGSGLNVGRYPPAVTSVTAIEPAELAWRRAAKRVAASPVPIEREGLDGQRIPLPDSSFDCALSTFTLCTIPDVEAALRELRRVVRPGGLLCFLEHGAAPHAGVARWQRRFDPVQQRLAGGCHLTRDIPALLVAAGWRLGEVERFYAPGTPRPWGAMWLGTALGGAAD